MRFRCCRTRNAAARVRRACETFTGVNAPETAGDEVTSKPDRRLAVVQRHVSATVRSMTSARTLARLALALIIAAGALAVWHALTGQPADVGAPIGAPGGLGAVFAAAALARATAHHPQQPVDPLIQAVSLLDVEVAAHRAGRRQVMRQQFPLAAGAVLVPQRVDDLLHRVPAHMPGRRGTLRLPCRD